MFGLPTATALLFLGIPVFWVLYTLGFLWITRDWPNARDEK